MRYRGFLDSILGRFYLPTRSALPANLQPSEVVLVGDRPHFRNAPGTDDRYFLTSLDVNAPGGVVGLDDGGTIPAGLLPAGTNDSTTIGQIIMWAGDPQELPGSHLFCDGANYLRAEFPDLFSRIRTRFGRPTDDRYFRVPDFRSRIPIGMTGFTQAQAGAIRKALVVNRGYGYTVGTHAFIGIGGTFTAPVTGEIDVVNENVPGQGLTGVVARIRILAGGDYSDIGQPSGGSPSNCAITLSCPTLGAGIGFTYDLLAAPLTYGSPIYQPWGVVMTDGGSGYVTPPGVTISGPSITGVTAVAILRGGRVAQVIVTDRGQGDITGATVAFSSGAAAASIATWGTDVVAGDMVGDQYHPQLVPELAPHTHSAPIQAGHSRRERDGGTGVEGLGLTGSAGGGEGTPMYPPGVGVGFYIRAS